MNRKTYEALKEELEAEMKIIVAEVERLREKQILQEEILDESQKLLRGIALNEVEAWKAREEANRLITRIRTRK